MFTTLSKRAYLQLLDPSIRSMSRGKRKGTRVIAKSSGRKLARELMT